MAKKHICGNCKYWVYQLRRPNFGFCEQMEDINDVEEKDMKTDKVYNYDYEGYRAGAYVGKDFSCKHWQSKT